MLFSLPRLCSTYQYTIPLCRTSRYTTNNRWDSRTSLRHECPFIVRIDDVFVSRFLLCWFSSSSRFEHRSTSLSFLTRFRHTQNKYHNFAQIHPILPRFTKRLSYNIGIHYCGKQQSTHHVKYFIVTSIGKSAAERLCERIVETRESSAAFRPFLPLSPPWHDWDTFVSFELFLG